MKELKDYTYEELVEKASHDVFSSLLVEGGKGLRTSVAVSIDAALRWKQEQNKKFTKKYGDINNLHCHAQICTSTGEELWGFDPHNEESRKRVHETLDEYLDILVKKMDEMKKNKICEDREDNSEDAGFHVYPWID